MVNLTLIIFLFTHIDLRICSGSGIGDQESREAAFDVDLKTGTQGQETLTGIMDTVTKTSLGMGKNIVIGMVISRSNEKSMVTAMATCTRILVRVRRLENHKRQHVTNQCQSLRGQIVRFSDENGGVTLTLKSSFGSTQKT